MNLKILTLTKTAVSVALLIAVQFATNGLQNQLITGSLVNLILIVSAVYVGLFGGITVAVISPVLAFLLGIGPKFIPLIPVIIVGNIVIVVLMHFAYKLSYEKQNISWLIRIGGLIVSAAAKFLSLFFLVRIAVTYFLTIPPKVQTVIFTAFSVTQLFTALIGGVFSLIIIAALKKVNS